MADLRHHIHSCDAIVFCTPEYAGALPGSFKNLLDWTVGDDQPGSIYRKSVAWLNVSSPASPAGGADAHASLARVLGYVGAEVVEAACRRLPITRADVGTDGLVADPHIRDQLQAVLQTVLDHQPSGPTPS